MIDKLPYWSFGLFAALFLAAYHVGAVLPAAYASEAVRVGAAAALVASLLAGAALARAFERPASAASHALALTAFATAAAAYALWAAFDEGAWLSVLCIALATTSGLGAGLGGALVLRTYGAALAELGAVSALLSPLRLMLVLIAFAAPLVAFPLLGLLRSGALAGALLVGLALLRPWVDSALDRPSEATWTLIPLWVAASLTLGGAALAESWVPLSDVLRHNGDVLYVLDGPRGRHVVTRAQGGVLLFSNDMLASTSTDQTRFAESLVHPALATAPLARRVLVLSAGTGAIEREVLRYPEVLRVTSVAPDERLSELSRTSAVLRELAGPPLRDPRLARIEAEAAPLVTHSKERYDVVIGDFGDPISYSAGKHFTRLFFTRVRELLEPEGVFALSLTSPLRTPQTHATLLATLRASGFEVAHYRAPLPTLGEWGLALAVVGRPLPSFVEPVRVPPGTTFVTARTLPGLFAHPPTPAGSNPAPLVNYLHDQPAVGLYHQEETALWH